MKIKANRGSQIERAATDPGTVGSTSSVPTHVPRLLGKYIAMIVAVAAALLGVTSAVPAMAVGSGYVYASPSLNMRTDAFTSAPVITSIPYHATVTIQCVKYGSAVSNSYGTSTMWDYVSYNGRSGFVADQWVWTGTAAATAPVCGNLAPPAPTPSTTARSVGIKRSFNAGVAGNCTWGAYDQWYRTTGYYPALTGNAKDWAASARATGWTVVYDAQPRSIVVFQPYVQGALGLGHVGWVTSVDQRTDGRYITFVEMNGTAGFNKWGTRTVKDIVGMQYILAP